MAKKKLDKMAVRKLLLAFTFILVVGLTALNIWLAQGIKPGESRKEASEFGQADIGGEFTLTDQHGNTVNSSDFRGKLMLVFFGFTHCPDICPVSLLTITNALNAVGEKAEQVAPIFITLDPERDTPEVMRDYLSNFHPNLIGLTGSKEQINAAASAYKTYFAKQAEDEHGDYTVDHSGFIYLIDRDGKYLAHFAHNDSEQAIVATLSEHLK